MKILSMLLILLLNTICLASAKLGASAQLRYTPEFILQQTLILKNWTYLPDVAFPEIRFASHSRLQDFQDDVEPQWHFRPKLISNVFIAHLNRIYLSDDAGDYQQSGRCIDDSLAHELTHYLQNKYRGWDLNDEGLELDAIEVQMNFRQKFCPPQTDAG